MLTPRLLHMLCALTEYEREVVVDHLLRGLTLQECADLYGCSKQNVGLLKQTALVKMRDALMQLDESERRAA